MMKRRDQLNDYRTKSVAELVTSIHKEEEQLLTHRFDNAMRKLKNIRAIRTTRRTIATLKTILHEKVASEAQTKEQK